MCAVLSGSTSLSAIAEQLLKLDQPICFATLLTPAKRAPSEIKWLKKPKLKSGGNTIEECVTLQQKIILRPLSGGDCTLDATARKAVAKRIIDIMEAAVLNLLSDHQKQWQSTSWPPSDTLGGVTLLTA